jgi:hypothetical protein
MNFSKKSLALCAWTLCSCAILLLCEHKHIRAQSFETAPRNHAGWVASFAGGTSTLGRGSLMLTTFYSYTVSPSLDVEGALHYVGMAERWGAEPRGSQISAYQGSSWTGDITVLWKPFSGGGQRFHVGVGPSLQWQAIGIPSTTLFGNGQSLYQIRHSEQSMLGGNFKIEYCIPVSGTFDVGMRGQIHLFLPPFSGSGISHSDGQASIGLFLRGNW